jgi:predicted TIM-barrel fold metal-dependent hydrolase
MTPVIDIHCHLGQYADGSMSADGARLCALFREAGITHGAPCSIEACYGGIDAGNAYTLAEVGKHDMLSALVVAHPHHLEASRRWVFQARSNPKIVGVKIHPVLGNFDILGGAIERLMDEVIAPSGLPVLSHVGNESPNVPIHKYIAFAAKFPKTRFIAAHLGIGVLGLADAAADAWTENPQQNVWFDMGTLRAFCQGAVERLLAAVGPDRICFGTDAPLYRATAFTHLLQTLDIPCETREKIAWRNLLTVIPALAGRNGVPA